jgi:hypothetical protein
MPSGTMALALVFGTGDTFMICATATLPWFRAIRRCLPRKAESVDSVRIVFQHPQETFF